MRESPAQMPEDDERTLAGFAAGDGGRRADTFHPRPPSSSVAGSSAAPELRCPFADRVLGIVLENVLAFLTCRRDRNAVSLVCKSWYGVEALTRSELFIGNCYAVSPRRAIRRFGRVRSVVLKGKPRFADFNMMPPTWGAYFFPWAIAMAAAYPETLEKIYLKRMTVTDDDLAILAHSFPSFRELVLVCCDGFGTSGLALVACNCRQLRVLDLIEDEVNDDEVDWISCFPETGTSLESLIFDCVESSVNFNSLLRLVSRSPSLRKLRLNRAVSIEQLHRLMANAPHLTHLGTGSFSSAAAVPDDGDPNYNSALAACKSLVCLSGFRDLSPEYLPAIYPACANLTSLNLSYAAITADQLRSAITRCSNLQIFWVLDSVADEGLRAVAASCKDLRKLRVFPVEAREDFEGHVSDAGLRAISEGCRKLQSILYFCQRMTNEALVAMSRNCPDLAVFRLCIMGRHRPDCATGEPMDEGFGAIVMNCKRLSRLAVSGLLTDRAFRLIGEHGRAVRTLSVAFAGDGDMALRYVLEGCPCLQKLEIRDSPFGDAAMLAGHRRYCDMRFVWMSSCRLTLRGCMRLAGAVPRLVVEVIGRGDMEDGGGGGGGIGDEPVETLYMYRSLEGPRGDAPRFVKIL